MAKLSKIKDTIHVHYMEGPQRARWHLAEFRRWYAAYDKISDDRSRGRPTSKPARPKLTKPAQDVIVNGVLLSRFPPDEKVEIVVLPLNAIADSTFVYFLAVFVVCPYDDHEKRRACDRFADHRCA
jgi:hypothetical protein